MLLRWAQDHCFPGPERKGLQVACVSRVSQLGPAAGCPGKGSPVLMPHLDGPLLWRAPNECREAIFPPSFSVFDAAF